MSQLNNFNKENKGGNSMVSFRDIQFNTIEDFKNLKEVNPEEIVYFGQQLPSAQYSVLLALSCMGVQGENYSDIINLDKDNLDLANNKLILKDKTLIDIPKDFTPFFELAIHTRLLADLPTEPSTASKGSYPVLGEKYLIKSETSPNNPISVQELEERYKLIINYINDAICD